MQKIRRYPCNNKHEKALEECNAIRRGLICYTSSMRTLKAPKTALQVVIADCRKVGISP
jgi:hypothetical protein